MKLSETDGTFWDLIGIMCHCEDHVYQWMYDKKINAMILKAPGETTVLNLDQLNDLLTKEQEYIKTRWRTGNNFDGKLEIDQ